MASSFSEAYKTILTELGDSLAKIGEAEVEHLLDYIVERGNIFVVGAGRMGLILHLFAMRLGHLGFKSHIVGSATCPPIGSQDLLIVASSSGETATVREVVGRANRENAEIIAITARPDSTIAELASSVLFVEAPSTLEAGGEGGVVSQQPMKTLFEQNLFVLLESVVLRIMHRTGQGAGDMAKRHANLE
jgi:6-phospho-3-hexuloisomerase